MSLRAFQNFDALATGSLPVGWTNGSGGNFQTGTTNPSGGTKCLNQAASLFDVVCVWTAAAAVAGNLAAQLSENKTVSGNTSSATNLLVSTDTAGTTGYVAAVIYNSGWQVQLFRSAGGSAWTFITGVALGFTPVTGNILKIKLDVNGGTVKAKAWLASGSEPGTWQVTYTDGSPLAVKYVGVYAGNGGLAGTLANADDVYLGDSGDSFNFTTIPVTDSNLYFSHRNTFSDGNGAMQPSNVKANSTYARILCAGGYVKGGFTGSTTCYLFLDTTNMGSASAGDCPRIKWKRDDAVLQTAQLAAGSTIVALGTGLGTGAHTFQTTYYDSSPTIDQYITPIGVKVLGFLVDSGGTSATPPPIFAKKLTVHSDSIGRGFCTDSGGNNSGDATHATPWLLASGLGAELGNVSIGGLGWGVAVQGNYQPFFTPGNDSASSWNKYFSGQSALVSGSESPMPDKIVVDLGTNDTLNSISDATVTASVSGYLSAQRAASSGASIYLFIPFGTFKQSAILAGFTAYGGAVFSFPANNGLGTVYTCANDPLVYLIYLGTDASIGLTNPGSATAEAPNDGTGVHPSAARNGQLAAQMMAAIRDADKTVFANVVQWQGKSVNSLTASGNVPSAFTENGGGFTPAFNTVNGTAPSGSTPALNGQTITGAANYPFSQSISVSNFNATSWTKLIFTVKANPSDADSAAILTIQLSNPGSGGDGLTILNGAAPVSPVTAGDGAIVVNQANSSGLTCTVTLTARGMGVAEGTYFWELTPYISGAKASWLGTGQFSVGPTVRVAAT